MNQPELWRLPQVMKRCGLARSTIYWAMENGGFPRPVKTGGRGVAWVSSEIQEWIAQKIQERDNYPDLGSA